jgi:hypothetical protein
MLKCPLPDLITPETGANASGSQFCLPNRVTLPDASDGGTGFSWHSTFKFVNVAARCPGGSKNGVKVLVGRNFETRASRQATVRTSLPIKARAFGARDQSDQAGRACICSS